MNDHAGRVGAGLIVVAVLALAACGGSTPGPDSAGMAAQPERNGSLAPAAIVDLPKPGGSQPFGAPTGQDGAWTQSFQVDGLSPLQTVQFYTTALGGGWAQESAPLPLGHCSAPGGASATGCTYRAVWTSGTETLEVVADPAGGSGFDPSSGTELSLVLSNS